MNDALSPVHHKRNASRFSKEAASAPFPRSNGMSGSLTDRSPLADGLPQSDTGSDDHHNIPHDASFYEEGNLCDLARKEN
jgi:hypothetical protein